MFESDDFDEVLSQFDISDTILNNSVNKSITSELDIQLDHSKNSDVISNQLNNLDILLATRNKAKHCTSVSHDHESNARLDQPQALNAAVSSPKHNKRKIINSLFDYQTKRKFPGPAGLLTGTIKDNHDNICHLELLSQDVEVPENHINNELFESPLWKRLKQDAECWNLTRIDSIKTIKSNALTGNLRKRKAETIIAFIESIDRSASDPLIILRDISGSIKCTLHRDAWSAFSMYIVSECCALALWKSTVLTTGTSFKKHYLNITLSNIIAIYSSAILNDDLQKPLPDGYEKITTDSFTIIKKEICPNKDLNVSDNLSTSIDDYLEGIDSSIFLDEAF